MKGFGGKEGGDEGGGGGEGGGRVSKTVTLNVDESTKLSVASPTIISILFSFESDTFST